MLSEHELIKALRDDFAPAATQLDSLSRVLHNEQFRATSPEGYTGHLSAGARRAVSVSTCA